MAKKKNRRPQRQTQQKQRATQITKKDVEQGKNAIKTMLKGVIYLAIFICFFAFKISGKTMYERASDLFSSDEEVTLSDDTSAKSSAKPSAK